jgi:hypothetical protein
MGGAMGACSMASAGAPARSLSASSRWRIFIAARSLHMAGLIFDASLEMAGIRLEK